MRIVHVGDARPSSVFVARWAEDLAKRHDVHVISFYRAELDGIKVHVVPRVLLGVPYGDRMLGMMVKAILAKIKPDVVHAHYTTSYAYVAALANYHTLLVQAWGSDIWVASEMGEKWQKRTELALKKADRVLMTSDALRQHIEIRYGRSEKMVVIPPIGIDLKVFAYRPDRDGRQFVVFSPRGGDGRPHYRQDVIDEAMQIMAGSGSFPTLKYIKAPTEKSKEEMAELYHRADCVISVPYSDQFASTLQEAMACGCVPIAADLPAYRGYLKHGWNARVLGKVAAPEIVEQVIWCMENREGRQEYRERNRGIAEREFDWDKCMKGLEEIYEEVGK